MIFLSLFCGISFGITGYFLLVFLETEDAAILSLFGGAGVTILLYTYLLIHKKVMDKKYSDFEKTITSEIYYKTNGNFNLSNGKLKNANIYLCEKSLLFVSFDEKPYVVTEVPLDIILRYESDDIHLNIYTSDGQLYVVTIPDTQNFIKALQTHIHTP